MRRSSSFIGEEDGPVRSEVGRKSEGDGLVGAELRKGKGRRERVSFDDF